VEEAGSESNEEGEVTEEEGGDEMETGVEGRLS